MKMPTPTFSALRVFLPGLLAVACLADSWGETDSVTTELIQDMPSAGVMVSFGGADYTDGWGWIRIDEEWRDIGMSFRAPSDGSFDTITLRIQKVPAGIPAGTEFKLEVFETNALGDLPDSGVLVFEGRGTLDISPDDNHLYLALKLPQKVPVSPEMIYTFLLSFVTADPSHHIIFENNIGYQNGQSWYRSEQTQGTLKALNQSDKPGLVFAIQ